MALSAGSKLGPHEILSLIGAGGMGEVYKAKDTRLDRTVAIKVLPSHLSDNPDLKQRLEREARALSSLNHPHICILYDIHLRQGSGGQVGEQDGVDYLVMEYLEGETLADQLKKGALPLDQALRFAIEISDALDKAHRQGVVHRDLKPGNIMLTKSGAKLLDFGLAKLRPDVSAETSSVLSALPTEEKPLTEKGSIIGTFQYMAPEQLEGKDADTRTDIFAFGTVMYEMLTGRKAFEGKSQASLISAIMGSDPPAIAALQPLTPPALDRVVLQCLSKDPDDRWQTAGDLGRELSWIAVGEPGPYYDIELSPDGTRLAMERLETESGTGDIWQLDLSRNLFSRLTSGPAWNMVPRWSPDGERIAFMSWDPANGVFRSYQVPSKGTVEPELLFDAANAEMFISDWSRDGRYIAFHRSGDLVILPLFDERELIPFLDSEFRESQGRFSPGGHFFAYVSDETGRREVYVTTFPEPGSKWRISTEGGQDPRWRSDGEEMFYLSAEGKLMAVKVELDSGFAAGVPEELFPVGLTAISYRSNYAPAADGQRFLVLTGVEGAPPPPFNVVLNWTTGLEQ
jgi:serine/threonine protein kinase